MTPGDLDRLEALARAATSGPWVLNPGKLEGLWHQLPGKGRGYGMLCWVEEDKHGNLTEEVGFRSGDADRTFIAAANPSTVLRLIAECRRKITDGTI